MTSVAVPSAFCVPFASAGSPTAMWLRSNADETTKVTEVPSDEVMVSEPFPKAATTPETTTELDWPPPSPECKTWIPISWIDPSGCGSPFASTRSPTWIG